MEDCTVPNNANPFIQNNQLTDNELDKIDRSTSSNHEFEWTDEQRKIWFDEQEMETTDALKAVVGYACTDEQRYCRFYNPITNECFKGSKCLLLHAPLIEGGYYTRDNEKLEFDAVKFQFPSIGSVIKILVTHIIDVENIYANILPFNSFTLKQANLKELTLKINSSKNILKYKKLEHPPGKFQQFFLLL